MASYVLSIKLNKKTKSAGIYFEPETSGEPGLRDGGKQCAQPLKSNGLATAAGTMATGKCLPSEITVFLLHIKI